VHLYDLMRSTAAAPALTLLPDGSAWGAGGQVLEAGCVAEAGGSGSGSSGGGSTSTSTSSGNSSAAPGGAVHSLAFHPRQRRTLAVGYASGAVAVWRLPWRLAQPAQGEAAALEAFLALSFNEES
jgi:hypothetical protein